MGAYTGVFMSEVDDAVEKIGNDKLPAWLALYMVMRKKDYSGAALTEVNGVYCSIIAKLKTEPRFASTDNLTEDESEMAQAYIVQFNYWWDILIKDKELNFVKKKIIAKIGDGFYPAEAIKEATRTEKDIKRRQKELLSFLRLVVSGKFEGVEKIVDKIHYGRGIVLVGESFDYFTIEECKKT